MQRFKIKLSHLDELIPAIGFSLGVNFKAIIASISNRNSSFEMALQMIEHSVDLLQHSKAIPLTP